MRNENAGAVGPAGVKVAPGGLRVLERGSLVAGEFSLMPRFCRAGATAVFGLAALALAGCASTPQTAASRHSKEYFPSSIYGAASPKVVADGQPVPRGGGQYLVGRPYTVAGRVYVPRENSNYVAVGLASWYGDAFHGRMTANGEVYDKDSLSAAHPTMPLPSYARVTNLGNGYSVIVRVNDRGPFHGGRVMDVSSRVADVLDIKAYGTARVKVEYVGPAPMEGSDDNQLLASLRTDGAPAKLDGYAPASTMVAEAAPRAADAFTSLFAAKPAPTPPPPPRPSARAVAVDDSEDVAEAPPPPSRRVVVHPPVPPERPFDLGFAKSNLRTLVASSSHSPSSKPSHSYGPFAKLLDRDSRGGKADN
jgi:rare lipoprotein A